MKTHDDNQTDEAGLQPSSQPSADSSQLGTNAPDVDACVKDAIASLGIGTDPAMNAAGTLARSVRLWKAVEPLRRELLTLVRQDAGGIDDAPQTLLALQEAFVEASLFRKAMFARLVESDGPITAKGKTRALYTAYLAASDRESKLAQVLGLTRKARKVATVADLLERS